MLRRAAFHKGGAFTEVYQNCNVFNDDAFVSFTDRGVKEDRQLFVEHGKPLLFGEGKKKGLRIDPRTLALEVVVLGENGVTESDILVHDETNSTIATMLTRMPFPAFPVAMGVLYAQERPSYEQTLVAQHEARHGQARQGQPGEAAAFGRDLESLSSAQFNWTL